MSEGYYINKLQATRDWLNDACLSLLRKFGIQEFVHCTGKDDVYLCVVSLLHQEYKQTAMSK